MEKEFSMSNLSLDEYESTLNDLITSDSIHTFDNKKPEEAALLMRRYFELAQSYVKVFCQQLSSAVFSNEKLLKAIGAAKERDVDIHFVIQRAIPDSKDLRDLLRELDVPLNTVAQDEDIAKHPFNFVVSDDKRIRVEEPPSSVIARASVNSPEQAKALSSLFDVIEGVSAPVQ